MTNGNGQRTRLRVMSKALGLLYDEACEGGLTLIATLIGAALEGVKDELSAMPNIAGASRDALEGRISLDHLLVDDGGIEDDDFPEVDGSAGMIKARVN